MSQLQDLEAINHYMRTVSANTPKAADVRAAWNPWYDGLGWLEMRTSDSVLQEARTRRNAFNIHNATTEKQAAQVQAVIEHSADNERIDLSKVLGKTNKEIAQNFKAPVAHPTLRKGSRGAAVLDLENVLGINPADTVFDAKTEAAVKVFQKSHDLKDDGICGPKTWAMLYGAASATTGNPPPVAVVDSTKQYPPAKMPPTNTSSGKGKVPIVRAPQSGKSLPPSVTSEVLAQATPVKHNWFTPTVVGGTVVGGAIGGVVGGPVGVAIGAAAGTAIGKLF